MDLETSQFLKLILAGDRAGAHDVAKRCLQLYGVAFVYERLVTAAMREVGELWCADRISVADEHLATATAAAAVLALYPHIPWPAVRTGRVIIACPQGEQHGFGARLVADLLALDGWADFLLGADVPHDALVRKAAELSPTVVALSVTLPSNLAASRKLMDRLRNAGTSAKILLGGRAAAVASDLAKTVGADAIGYSATEAVEIARAWR